MAANLSTETLVNWKHVSDAFSHIQETGRTPIICPVISSIVSGENLMTDLQRRDIDFSYEFNESTQSVVLRCNGGRRSFLLPCQTCLLYAADVAIGPHRITIDNANSGTLGISTLCRNF